MNNILQCIRDNIGPEHCASPFCSKDKCKKDKCDVYLNGTLSPRLIVDPESESLASKFPNYFSDNKRKCDFILFFENSDGTVVIAPLELKHGRAEANIAAKQLQAGASFAEHMIPKSCRPACQPILFHSGNLHKLQRTELNKAKIHFRGAQLTIRTAKCGQPGNLANALPDEQVQRQGRRKR